MEAIKFIVDVGTLLTRDALVLMVSLEYFFGNTTEARYAKDNLRVYPFT